MPDGKGIGKKKLDGKKVIRDLLSSGGKNFLETEVKALLDSWQIPVPAGRMARDIDEAFLCADAVGYPVALKIVSRDVSHKSDVGGVATGIRDSGELRDAWNVMLFEVSDCAPTADIDGFLVEKMARPGGVEVIVGAIRDEQFGLAVMFGIGGVAVELMKDVSFCLAPVSRTEAIAMIEEVQGYPLLTGYRGGGECDIGAIADVIIRLSEKLVEGAGCDIKELEINPLISYKNGLVAVDARASLV